VPEAARADAAVAHAAGRARRGHRLAEGPVGRIGVRGNHHRTRAQQRHGRQVALGVVGQARDQRGQRGMAVEDDREGVAVRRRGRHRGRADRARGATPVFHHHRLAELALQRRLQDPRDLVDRAARRKDRYETDGLGLWPRCGLGVRLRDRQHEGGHGQRGRAYRGAQARGQACRRGQGLAGPSKRSGHRWLRCGEPGVVMAGAAGRGCRPAHGTPAA
jgi:hypothetical protein